MGQIVVFVIGFCVGAAVAGIFCVLLFRDIDDDDIAY